MKISTFSTRPICFKHWTRKNYAAFCSIGKTIKIGVLAVSCSIISTGGKIASAQTQSAHFQQDSASQAEQNIGAVVVQGIAQSALPANGGVTLQFSRSDIAALPVQNVQQLLEYVANIDLRQRGANGVQADIRMRGGSEEQTLVLLNGVNVADPRTGHHSLNVPIDLASVDRIEIVQMPGAFAGAVNIITGNAPKTQVAASIGTGSHYYSENKFDINYVKPKLTVTAAASLLQSDGYIYNTDFKTTNAFAQGRFLFNDGGRIEAQFGFQEKSFGANSFYSVGENEFEHVQTFISSVSYAKNVGKISLQANVYHRRSYDNYCKHRDSLVFAAYDRNQDNYHQGDVVGGDLYVGYVGNLGKTTLGVQQRAEHIFSNKLGEPMTSSRPSFENGIDYTYEKWRNTLTAFVKHAYVLRRLTLAASVVGNYSNSFGYYTLGNTQADFSILPQWNVALTLHQSLRLPTFTDLFYNGTGYLPNPDLKPERATTIELGTQYHKERLQINAALFYRDGTDLIDWVYIDEKTQQCLNHVSIATIGAEAGGRYTFNRYFKNLTLSYAFLHLTSPQPLTEKAKGRLFAYLKHKVSVSCAHELVWHLQAAWNVTHEQRNGSYTSRIGGTSAPFVPVTLVDARLQWAQESFTLYVSADNVLDTKYYDYNAVPQAGRWYKVGGRVTC
jgi:iron complex outermembrane receptor protein